MHAKFEAWTERKGAGTAVSGVFAGDSAFRALRKACRIPREDMQATKDMYLKVYAYELEKFTKAGDTKGWYRHLKGGWKLQGKRVGSTQYIKDED